MKKRDTARRAGLHDDAAADDASRVVVKNGRLARRGGADRPVKDDLEPAGAEHFEPRALPGMMIADLYGTCERLPGAEAGNAHEADVPAEDAAAQE